VAQALLRLKREGKLERLSKGVYYRTRDTAFGKSRPNPATIQSLATKHKTVFPAGVAAANLLGFMSPEDTITRMLKLFSENKFGWSVSEILFPVTLFQLILLMRILFSSGFLDG